MRGNGRALHLYASNLTSATCHPCRGSRETKRQRLGRALRMERAGVALDAADAAQLYAKPKVGAMRACLMHLTKGSYAYLHLKAIRPALERQRQRPLRSIQTHGSLLESWKYPPIRPCTIAPMLSCPHAQPGIFIPRGPKDNGCLNND